ncbi:hypothetical protein AVMA1855_07125 [Acidovorax sp. SUPP1855]|uniref:hypothetical protein n=1 Tax=Acidovorax sp. SUPP1855 TaxID=431774 RepID=UPI0023DE3C5F|nr:hypothetical protein [Acidovorax sp. SUPP1855]GKS83899.1 hypothetical protein AVMA1855_07125 [Acidovorax sp. SUPP1855]
MKCFVHQAADAVGTCRACNKGICPACAKDLGHSICCSQGPCETKARTLDSQVAQSSVVLAAQRRNRFLAPLFFIFAGALFIAFSGSGKGSWFSFGHAFGLGFIVFGIVLGIASHRYARELERKA